MAELDPPAIKKQSSDLPAQKKILSNFLYKAILFAIFVALLPLFPPHISTSTSPTLLSRTWELLHLLLVGVAVSYGLFSQRNADPDPDKDIDAAVALKADSPHSYVSRLLQISPVFDEDSTAGESKLETWSSQYRGPDPVVVESKPLLLPVRNLMKSRIQNTDSGVLHSPIPWKSRSRLETMDDEDEDPIIAAGFFSPEMRGKTSEDYIGGKNHHVAAPPAPPPPPPPPLFNHASLSSERKEMKKSIKDELKDLRIKGREGFFKHSSPKSLRTVEKPPDLLQQKNPTETKKTGTKKKKKVEFMEKMIVMSDDSETEKGSDSCDDEDAENSSTESRSETKENEVDKKADEFIAKFREQIRLQRIESIKKSSKHRAVKNNVAK